MTVDELREEVVSATRRACENIDDAALAARVQAARRTGCADADDELSAARGICLGIVIAVPLWLALIVLAAWGLA